MKICYLCSDVDVEVLGDQGCSVHVREFTNALVEAGHDVFLLCSWLGGRGDNSTLARIIEIEPGELDAALGRSLEDDPAVFNQFLERDLKSILWNAWLQIRGAEIFARERPDFVYERYALFGTGGQELCRRFGIPHLLELNAPLCDQQEGYRYFPFIHTARQLEPRIISGADAIVALTGWLADWSVRLGAERARVHVLADAVADRLFAQSADGAAIRRSLGWEGKQIVGFVGSFHHWHDVAGLIDAFARLSAADPDRRLLLVGDGRIREELERRVGELDLNDAVRFTGRVRHEEVPHHLAAMDVAVVPYAPIENFFFSPMKLFESMAAGRPTVAADLGEISQIVSHGETGCLYPAGDNHALASAIGALLEDRGLAARIGAAAREHVLAHHTWGRVAGRVVELARELIAS